MQCPSVVFIVPYKNRPTQKHFFTIYIQNILRLRPTIKYEVYFSHQYDNRSFNRGGVKNIGFLAVRRKYPDEYKQITFVFNDIDTIPYTYLFDYTTTPGVVKHFYGFRYALGGIVSITGEDFERINGFPNFWGWGMEDTILQQRCEAHRIVIDRTHFYPLGSPEILHLFDGVARILNVGEMKQKSMQSSSPLSAAENEDGLKSIRRLYFNIGKTSFEPRDNLHWTEYDNIWIINITRFITGVPYNKEHCFKYDLRIHPRNMFKVSAVPNTSTQHAGDWSHIPSIGEIMRSRK